MFLMLLFVVGVASVMGEENNVLQEKPTNIGPALYKAPKITESTDPADEGFDFKDSGDNNLYNLDYKSNNVHHNYIKRFIRQAIDANVPTSTEFANIFPVKCPKGRVRVGIRCIPKNKRIG